MRWQDPPWIPLGSPATMAHLDLSDLTQSSRMYSAVGDFPEWFYRLRLPKEMWPWFVLDGITAEEFYNYATSKGIKVPLPPVGAMLAVIVLLMGWSWAPFLAHMTLLNLLDEAACPDQLAR